jgi:hypothetical protein
MLKNLLLFITLLIGTSLPFLTEAATPSNYASSLVDETAMQITFPNNLFSVSSLPIVSPGNSFPLTASYSSTTKNSTVIKPAKKTKLNKNAKSGVTLALPAKPAFVLSTKQMSEPNPQYGYMHEITVKNAKKATALSLVSSGIFSLIGWDSMQYGAESTLRDIVTSNSFKLPPTLLTQLVSRKETLLLNGHTVAHSYIEYKGARIFGMYAASKKYDEVMVGVISLYADPSLLPPESRADVLSPSQAQELLVTMLSKSKVNQKQSKNYFNIE